MPQLLKAILALALLSTITLNINRVIFLSRVENIDNQIRLEAINYGQSVVEILKTFTYDTIDDYIDNNKEQTQAFDTGTPLFVSLSMKNLSMVTLDNINYKNILVSVYLESDKTNKLLEYTYSIFE